MIYNLIFVWVLKARGTGGLAGPARRSPRRVCSAAWTAGRGKRYRYRCRYRYRYRYRGRRDSARAGGAHRGGCAHPQLSATAWRFGVRCFQNQLFARSPESWLQSAVELYDASEKNATPILRKLFFELQRVPDRELSYQY